MEWNKTYVTLILIVAIGVISLVLYHSFSPEYTSGSNETLTITTTTPPWHSIVINKTIIYKKTFTYKVNATPSHAIELTKQGFVECNASFIYWPQYPGMKITTIPVKKGDTVLVIVNGTGYDEKVVGIVLMRKDTDILVGEAPIQPAKGIVGYGFHAVEYTGFVDVYLRGFIHAIDSEVVFEVTIIVCRE